MPATATVSTGTASVHVEVQMSASVTKIKLGRVGPDGYAQVIRYGDMLPTTGGFVAVDDYEVPLDTPVYYVASQAAPVGSEKVTSNTVTVPSRGQSWLKDPGNPSLNMRIPVVTSIESLTRTSKTGVFPIIDRVNPITISTKRGGPVGTLVAHTLTDDQRIDMRDLLAKGSVLLLQTPAAYGFGSEYITVVDVEEKRLGLAMEQSRMWTLPFIVVDRPEGLDHQSTVDRTWRAVRDTYATWNDLAAAGKTWEALLEEGP